MGLTAVQKLEKELEDAKRKANKSAWEPAVKQLKEHLDVLKGRVIIHLYTSSSYQITKVTDVVEKYYADREGFYGDWSSRRWFELKGHSYIVGSRYFNMRSAEVNQVIIPIASRKSWNKVYERYVDLGKIDVETFSMDFGKEAYDKNDSTLILKEIGDFSVLARMGTLEQFNEVEALYHKLALIWSKATDVIRSVELNEPLPKPRKMK